MLEDNENILRIQGVLVLLITLPILIAFFVLISFAILIDKYIFKIKNSGWFETMEVD